MPFSSQRSPWQRHKERWSDCRECPLCERRTNVVLTRGSLPCDVLFVGEAPGQSEDVLGKPFVGPAGKLLDEIIAKSMFGPGYVKTGRELTYAMTNLVACIPLGEDGAKTAEPPEESIKACAGRLREIVDIADPKLIVCVGLLSTKWVPKLCRPGKDVESWAPIVSIVHPAAILRADVSQRGLMIQRTVVTLADAVSEIS